SAAVEAAKVVADGVEERAAVKAIRGAAEGDDQVPLRGPLQAREHIFETLGAAAQLVDALGHQHELNRAAVHPDAERLQAGLHVEAVDLAPAEGHDARAAVSFDPAERGV